MGLKREDIAGGYLGAKYGEGMVEGAVATTSILARLPLPLFLAVLGITSLVILGSPKALMKAGKSFIKQFDYEHQMELVRQQRGKARAIGQLRE